MFERRVGRRAPSNVLQSRRNTLASLSSHEPFGQSLLNAQSAAHHQPLISPPHRPPSLPPKRNRVDDRSRFPLPGTVTPSGARLVSSRCKGAPHKHARLQRMPLTWHGHPSSLSSSPSLALVRVYARDEPLLTPPWPGPTRHQKGLMAPRSRARVARPGPHGRPAHVLLQCVCLHGA